MSTMISERRSYVGGRWIEGDEALAVENPADESHVTDVSVTPFAEFSQAIGDARDAFDDGPWAAMPASRSGPGSCTRSSTTSRRTAPPLVATMVAEAGQPIRFAEQAQLQSGVALGRTTIDLYLSMKHEQPSPVPADELIRGRLALSLRRHEPIGVVAAITPYNAAIVMAFQKLIPALIAGNSVILRPSPLTPLSSLIFGAAADAADLPPGVLSIVVESGAAGAELLTTDPRDRHGVVHRLHRGRASRSSPRPRPTVKRVALELGGKSAQIYLPDAVDQRRPGRGRGGGHDGRPGVRRGHPHARPTRPQGRGARGGERRVFRRSPSARPPTRPR